MLDGLYKKTIDRLWVPAARVLVRAGLYPNQVTWIGLSLVLVACLLYLVHRDSLWFGVMLACAFVLDALDGAVARLRACTTAYGGYLDATLDRYQEIAVLAAIAYVNDYWISAFAVVTGALLTSYNKARVALEMPIDNSAWPDLVERFERLVLLCAGLILDRAIALPEPLPERFLLATLLLLGVLTHLTAAQRFLRARRMLRAA